MYNKIFTKILDSSIWLAPDPHRLVWITLIAAMDRDGFAQFACAANVAARARVDLAAAESALLSFESPDPNSGDPDFEGRRIERVPGGWLVLNAPKYRELVSQAVASEQSKLRMQAFRRRNALRSVTDPLRPVAPSEAEATATSEAKTVLSPPPQVLELLPQQAPERPKPGEVEFKQLQATYPKRGGSQRWDDARKACNARITEGYTWVQILDGAQRYADFIRATGKERSEHVQQAATFVGRNKGFLEPWGLPAGKAEARLSQNLNAAEEFMRRTENPA